MKAKKISVLLCIVLLSSCQEKMQDGKVDTLIIKEYCYEYQEWNYLGQPIEGAFGCMHFIEKMGNNYEEAFEKIKPHLYIRVEQCTQDTRETIDNFDVRQQLTYVRNAPSQCVEYKSILIYMYDILYDDYVLYTCFCVIDSNGNVYRFISPDD